MKMRNACRWISVLFAFVAACAETPTSDHPARVGEADGMRLLHVPAGPFTMGSDDGDETEQSAHEVTLDEFWIDETEVTNGMYARCVADGNCAAPAENGSLIRDAYYGEATFENYPVIFVDWDMAKTYCEWAGRELPTEAQWEKAARGTEAPTYPWGNSLPNTKLANSNDVVGDTTAVGAYPDGASPYGALDMAGNVWEWTSDLFDGKSTHVLRGGSWNLDDNSVRATFRGTHPSEPNLGIGFRCATETDLST